MVKISKEMKKHNGELALWKFMFAMMIFFHHAYIAKLTDESPIFLSFTFGSIAVSFFFIVSGYFMTKKALMTKCENAQIGKITFNYLAPKIIRFFPLVLVAFVLSYALFCADSGGFAIHEFINSLPNLFMITMTGVRYTHLPGLPVWYISAMLIGMLVLFPIILKYRKNFAYIIAPIITVLTYGYLFHQYGDLSTIYNYEGFITTGVLRAVGGLALGSIVYLAAERLSRVRISKRKRLFLTILEFILLITPFLVVGLSKYNYDLLLLSVMTIGVAIAASEQSLLLGLLSNRIVFYMEEISLPIYLFHYAIILWINRIFDNGLNFYARTGLALLMTICFSVIVTVLLKRRFERRLKRGRANAV